MTQPTGLPTPTPRQVAALMAQGDVWWERLPGWATQWLLEGYDTPTLRELAGEPANDPEALRDLMDRVLDELRISLPSPGQAAAEGLFVHFAQMCLSGLAGERWVAQRVEEYLGYLSAEELAEVRAQPLADLYRIDEAWTEGWAPDTAQLREAVRAACVRQLDRQG